jgi:hypothetical protein
MYRYSSTTEELWAALTLLPQNPKALATFFWPVDSAWALLSQQLCMTVQSIQDTVAATPDVAVQYMNINILNGG